MVMLGPAMLSTSFSIGAVVILRNLSRFAADGVEGVIKKVYWKRRKGNREEN